MKRGSFTISWGDNGGFYYAVSDTSWRICLAWVAFTIIWGIEFDDLIGPPDEDKLNQTARSIRKALGEYCIDCGQSVDLEENGCDHWLDADDIVKTKIEELVNS